MICDITISRRFLSLLTISIVLIVESILFFIFKGIVDPFILTIIYFTVSSVFYIFVIKRSTESKLFFYLLVASYLIRLFLIFFDRYGNHIFIMPNSNIDSSTYHRLASNMEIGLLQLGNQGRGLYPIFLRILYLIFGVNRIMAQYINLIASMFVSLVFIKTLKLLKIEEKRVVLYFVILNFFPQILIFSSVLMREALIICSLSFSIYYFIKWYISAKIQPFLLAIPFGFIVMIFHEALVVFALGYTLCFAIYDRNAKKFILEKKAIFTGLTSLLLLAFIIFISRDFIIEKFTIVSQGSWKYFFLYLSQTDGGSSYLPSLNYGNIWDVLISIIPKCFYFLISPVPWDWRNLMDVAAFLLDSVFYIYFIIQAVISIKKSAKEYKYISIIFIIIAVAFVVLFAMGTHTAGAAIRHRMKILPLFMFMFIIPYSKSKVHIPIINKSGLLKNKKIKLKDTKPE